MTNTFANKEENNSQVEDNVWQSLGCPKYVLAPMVDASELPWRLLSRKYGAQLCYTPMVPAHMFINDKKLRNEILQSTPLDRPLIVQFCGNDAKNITEAAKLAEPHVDGIDLNIGCPQLVAKRGHYGAYLQDEWDLLTEIFQSLRANIKLPISCKIRIYQDIDKTVEYAKMLERAGCQLLAVHGRTVDQRGMETGLASWDHISAVKKAVSIPVIANGNIQCLEDVHRCLDETGVNAVMTAEGNLYNPAIFAGINPVSWEIAEEYLQLVDEHPVSLTYVRGHIFKIFHHLLSIKQNFDVRHKIGETFKLEDMKVAVRTLKERFLKYHLGEEVFVPDVLTASYNLTLPPWICQPYVRPTFEERLERKRLVEENENSSEKIRGFSVKRIKKQRKLNGDVPVRKKPELCNSKKKKCTNPKGLSCDHNMCRTCCKDYCVNDKNDCIYHRHFKTRADRINFINELKKNKSLTEPPTTDILTEPPTTDIPT